jgi:NAD(P)H-flavin reductase
MYTDEWRILFMFKIVEKKSLNPTVSKITVEAPLIAKKAEPGQSSAQKKIAREFL